jgi:hypothetical protein
MFDVYDAVALTLLLVSGMAQAVPIYYSIRLFAFAGWTRYWSPAWLIFIVSMAIVMARRLFAIVDFDCNSERTTAWIIHQAVIPILTSGLWSVFAAVLHNFFKAILALNGSSNKNGGGP